jgi:hypothetical protein
MSDAAPALVGRRVIVTGLAGSGKSTFAFALAAKTGLPVIYHETRSPARTRGHPCLPRHALVAMRTTRVPARVPNAGASCSKGALTGHAERQFWDEHQIPKRAIATKAYSRKSANAATGSKHTASRSCNQSGCFRTTLQDTRTLDVTVQKLTLLYQLAQNGTMGSFAGSLCPAPQWRWIGRQAAMPGGHVAGEASGEDAHMIAAVFAPGSPSGTVRIKWDCPTDLSSPTDRLSHGP